MQRQKVYLNLTCSKTAKMDVLQNMIRLMSKEEVRNFKLWLNSTNASNHRKDIQLFDYIRKAGEDYDDDLIHSRLYGKNDKNSFYRLKNRLQEDVGAHLALQHSGKQENNRLYWLLSLAQIFSGKNAPAVALHFLRKAEKRAVEAEQFDVLDIVYSGIIKLSADLPEINPEEYIRKRNENTQQLNRIRETDQVLAAVTYRLKMSQNFAKHDAGLMKLLDNTIREFTRDENIRVSKSFQTRMFRAVSQSLIQQHQYTELEKYVRSIYQQFLQRKWFDKNNHETKVQMLIYLINALFKNRQYRESLDFAEVLGTALEEHNGFLYDKYFFFYYNALVINYAQTDLTRGLRALDELEKEMKDRKNSYYDFFIYLNKATLLFYQRKNNEAIRNVARLYTTDHYRKADTVLQLKIGVAECIMQYESGEQTIAKKRLEQVRKQFKSLLPGKDFKEERFVLKVLNEFLNTEADISEKLRSKIQAFIKEKDVRLAEDTQVINYRSWLDRWLKEQLLNR